MHHPQALIGLVLAGGLFLAGWVCRRADVKKWAYGPRPSATPEERAEYYRRGGEVLRSYGKWTMRIGGVLVIVCVIAAFV